MRRTTLDEYERRLLLVQQALAAGLDEEIGQTWQHIDTERSERSKRRYIADFERYRGSDIEIFVGV